MLAASNGREADVCISCVNVEGAELSAVLITRPRGRIFYFATTTSFTRAALGAEGVSRDVDMLIGNGYAEGHAELVGLSHEMMMNLAAFTAGVDRPLGTRAETMHLYSYLMLFIQGATLAHYTGDRDAKRAEVAAGLESFDAEFLQPSIARRQAVAFMCADMAIEFDGLRLVTWRGASRADQGLPFAREAALARKLAADKGMRIGLDGVQLLGGHGYTKEHPVERWYRDLRAVGVAEGVVVL